MKYYLGVDLGGTNLRTAVVEIERGQILIQRKCPTLAVEGQEAVIARMLSLVDDVIVESGISVSELGGIGVGVPGTPDIDRGTILLLPNLPGQWRNVPLQSILEQHTGLNTSLINDVRAMTLAEWQFGAGRGVDTMVCIAIGTGIGGGVVINGQLHLGIGGTAGEFGHQIVEANGPRCGCGGHGCLELYASGPAIASMGVKEVMHGHTTLIGELVNYDLNQVTAEVVFAAAEQGDPAAIAILQRAGKYLGIAVSNILGAISPRKIILGGGVAQAGSLLLPSIWEVVRERVHVFPLNEVEMLTAELGTSAGLVGAAIWAKHRRELAFRTEQPLSTEQVRSV